MTPPLRDVHVRGGAEGGEEGGCVKGCCPHVRKLSLMQKSVWIVCGHL